MKFHDELNQALFDGMELKPEVKDKLKEIADAFIEYLEIDKEAVEDIRLYGSSVSYNYTKYSDLDLHLVVDYDKIHENCPIVEGYLWAFKAEFNKNHDISIYDVPVEVYAEKTGTEAISNGIYSLTEDKWLKEPEKIEPTDNDAAVEAKFNELKEAIDRCDDSEVAEELQNKIYEMRKAGLDEVGEFSTENLAFKALRNAGCIEKLKQLKKEKVDKQLSLESFEEAMDFDYVIEFNYEDDYAQGEARGQVKIKANSEDEALQKAEDSIRRNPTYAGKGVNNFRIVPKEYGYSNTDIIESLIETMDKALEEKPIKRAVRFFNWGNVKTAKEILIRDCDCTEKQAEEILVQWNNDAVAQAGANRMKEELNNELKVGDNVSTSFDNSINKRIGTVTKIEGDVAEVEYPEQGTLPARTDKYYVSDLVKTDDVLEETMEMNEMNIEDAIDDARGYYQEGDYELAKSVLIEYGLSKTEAEKIVNNFANEEDEDYEEDLDEDCATLEKKLDDVQSDLDDMIKAYSYNEIDEELVLQNLKKSIQEALA